MSIYLFESSRAYRHAMRPVEPPIGVTIARVAKTLSRAFDDELAAAGGSTPVWQILIALKSGAAATQRSLGVQLGIRQPTVTHHLAAMESSGLLVRTRDTGDKRAQRIELTDEGEALFHALREVASRFDRRLRRPVSEAAVATVRRVLAAMEQNALRT